MTTLRHSIAAVSRRLGLNRALRLAGLSCAIVAAATALALVLVRAAGVDLPAAWPWWVTLTPSAAGALLGAVVGWLQRPAPMQAAILLDRQLHLKDRIGTAQAIHDGAVREQTFAALASRDAERQLQRMTIAAAVPVRVGGEWGLAPLAAALVAATWFWMPVRHAPPAPIDDSAALSPAEQQALQQTTRQIAANLEQASDQLRDESLDPRAAEQLAALDRLAEQIAAPAGSPAQVQQLRDESAARLNELAEEIAQRSRRDLEAADQLARRFDGLQPRPEAPLTEQQLLDALHRGEFSHAAEALTGMFESAATPAERRRLADMLREMSEQVQTDDLNDIVDARLERENVRSILRSQGLDEDAIERIMAESDAGETESEPTGAQGDDHQTARPSDGTSAPAPQADDGALPRETASLASSPDAESNPEASPASPQPESAQPTDAQPPDASSQTQPPGPPTAPPTAEEMRRRLEDRGVDPEVADRLARQLEQTRRQDQASDQARRDAEQLSREFDEAAKQLDSPREQEPSPDQSTSNDQHRQDQGESPSKPPSETSQPERQPSDKKPDAAEGAATESREGATQGRPSQQRPGESSGEKQADQQAQAANDSQQGGAAQTGETASNPREPAQPGASDRAEQRRDGRPGSAPVATPAPGQAPAPSQDQSVRPTPSPAQKTPSAHSADQPTPAEGTPRGANEQPGGQPQEMTDQSAAGGVERESMTGEEQAVPAPSSTGEPSRNVDRPSGGPGGSLLDKLRELDQRRRDAQGQQAASEDLRRRAREIADNLTDEERRRLAAWARQYQREQGAPPMAPDQGLARRPDSPDGSSAGVAGEPGHAPGNVDGSAASPPLRPGSTEIVDARGPIDPNDPGAGAGAGDQIIAEWLSQGESSPSPDARAATQQRLESARRAAERAVNEQAVNRRYHDLIQRYFRGLDKAATSPGQAAEPSP